MPNNPVSPPLPADLPTNWVYGQTVGPNGTDVGLTQQHGYNYLMQAVNAAQAAINNLGGALADLNASDVGAIPSTEKGKANGVAELDSSGKVPAAQLPAMNYDPAGSAQAVQANLSSHINDKENPHGVTADQVGAYTKAQTLTSTTAQLFGLSGNASPDDVFDKLSKAAFNSGGNVTDVNGNLIGVQISTGSYVGTGNNSNKITLGVKPSFLVIVRGNDSFDNDNIIISVFGSENRMAGITLGISNKIYSNITFQEDGFTLTSDNVYDMNKQGVTFYYTAFSNGGTT